MFVTDLLTGEPIEITNGMDTEREKHLSTIPFSIEEQKFYYTEEILEEMKMAR